MNPGGYYKMKNYTITVNGVAYSVTVEETAAGAAPAAAPVAAPAPAAAPAAAPAPKAASAAAGSITVAAAVPGKVFKIEASVGQTVKAGDNIIILESMKMEIPVVAPEDGTVASINVTAGDAVRRQLNGYTWNSVESGRTDSLLQSDRRQLYHDCSGSRVPVFGNC